jgi:serine/threonine protein kinase
VRSLYDLPSELGTKGLEAVVAELVASYSRDGGVLLLDAVRTLLADDFVDPAVTDAVEMVYRQLLPSQAPPIRGPLGLYLALKTATLWSIGGQRRSLDLDAARELFADPAVRQYLSRYYEIDDYYDLSHATLHRVGTTSLILQCQRRKADTRARDELLALKCILPRYLTVEAIRRSTRCYKALHSVRHPSVPHVHDSTDRWIAMDFVTGRTLAEYFADRAVSNTARSQDARLDSEDSARARALGRDDILFIRRIGVAICRVLAELHALGHRHLDLSPSNIIITNQRDDGFDLALIDFGHNFAITDKVGSSDAFRRAALYVDPALVKDPSYDSARCDVYSLGIILLEAAAKRRLEKESITVELDRLWQGERPWDGAQGLGRIIDELIDEEPLQRLAMMPAELWQTERGPYEYLERLIRQETEVLELYEKRNEDGGFGVLRGVGLLRVWRNSQLSSMLDAAYHLDTEADDSYHDFPSLARWARLSLICWHLVLSLFVWLTVADLGWKAVADSVQQYVDLTGAPFEVGAFWDNLPGRLVALSFSLTAVTYYVNNYSLLSPKRLGSRLGRATEITMRTTAVGLTFPILWAMVWDPQAWPLCSGLGTLLVVANNYLTLRLAERAAGVGRRFSVQGTADRRFIDDVYKEWWRLMGYYSLAMLAVGVLLLTDLAQDEKVFAYLVVFINVAKMYRLNCVKIAPQVRGALARAILILRRAQRLDAQRVEAGPA